MPFMNLMREKIAMSKVMFIYNFIFLVRQESQTKRSEHTTVIGGKRKLIIS